ncbi:EF-hand domain-containing protein [Tropicimonas sp. TH_r6]|uniref:EF-hand domain-containing protein n=1 Tax=Tropicimonas sp. TH_r6 TaxID=3082085 RepID=UPI0029531FEE|nr:EF-hand domain-containing protein [Tropicimonas sp. TH_r6]MDV7144229.1 EF-hand domain-containing protein [Tropicimonas sp. TH_r6]
MTRITLLTTAIVTGLLVTTSAQARGFDGARMGPMMDPPSFAELDADGDGKVTTEELKAFAETAATKRFQDADTDGDGKLSAEEMTAAAEAAKLDRQARRQDAMIARLDTDKDGLVSEEEMKAAIGERAGKRGNDTERGERMIKRFDVDGDGVLSEEEFAKMQELAKDGMREGRFGGKNDRGGKSGRGDRGDRGGVPFWRN